jgi:DNA (cytosine-5)-methyltransferase 1
MVLSLFPGIGLLDMAFEQEGFCVVRGPDILWGGDIKRFHPPLGVFDGVIGGPPCQAHSRYAGINRKLGNKIAECLISEFARCVSEAQPEWFLMENVPKVPNVEVPGFVVKRQPLNMRWLGEKQSRLRVWQFGTRTGIALQPEIAVFEHQEIESACLASEGGSGRITNHRVNGRQKSIYHRRREFAQFCELQGLPPDFLSNSPFTETDKYRVVGNGVPLPMGLVIAKAVKLALAQIHSNHPITRPPDVYQLRRVEQYEASVAEYEREHPEALDARSRRSPEADA